MSEETIKKLIIEQLKFGACNRIHLHRECSKKVRLKQPRIDRSQDKKFEDMLEELIHEKKSE